MTSRQLWIISELFYPEQTSTGYFLSEIARGLASDWDVQVVCAQPTYSERGMIAPRRESWGGTTIHRLWGTRFDKDRLPLRLLNVATFTLNCLLFLLRRVRKGDRVLIVTNPPTLFPFVGWLVRMKGVKALLLVHDVYPDVLAVTGHLKATSLIFRWIDHAMRWACRQYDRIVVLGRDMQSLLVSKTGFDHQDVPIIPNWGDTDAVRPLSREENSFAKTNGMGDAFVVQFSGNIGLTHDVETLVSTAKLTEDQLNIQYWFIGYGGKAAKLTGSEEQSPKNVHIRPRQPREILGEMLSCADVTVIAFLPGMKGLSVPSRMYNVMASGTGIIAITEPGSELALVVEESDCGWVVPPHDVDALTQLIQYLATSDGQAEVARKGASARRAACDRYRLEHALDLYRKLLADLGDD